MKLKKHAVVVIGAGPAGLYAARQLAANGATVALLNRDIKPGGLAEYGIFHNKHKMKNGLRKQFRKLLSDENIHYFGNLMVGKVGDIQLNTLREMGFQAILTAVGAQDTKWLGLPGEELAGVYHAKDLVYHYNHLPPFSEQDYPIGKNVVLVGAGNVMLDIAHYCIRDLKVASVTAFVRRGPADVKFTKKEMALVFENLDRGDLDGEIERTRTTLEGVGQDADEARGFILSAEGKAQAAISETKFGFRFLTSVSRVLGENGKMTALEANETTMVLKENGKTSARNTDTTHTILADTLVFCIGDRVDANFGLPLNEWGEFAQHPEPRYPIKDISYEAYDPEGVQAVADVFLVGWARQASDGLVGAARKDGEGGAAAASQYLETLPEIDSMAVLEKLIECLETLDKAVVSKADWQKLDTFEQAKAEELGLEHFAFATNEEMLNII